jgi:hypothetical protein
MRIGLRSGLTAAVMSLALAACQGNLPDAPGAPDTTPASRRPIVKTASASPVVTDSPSTAPSGTVQASKTPASPSPSASAVLRVLQKPAGATRAITGTVSIDAHYASVVGGGRIIGNNGGQAIAFGAATLIGNNGGNIISDNGGGLVSKIKAPVAGVVSNNGSSYRVAQAGGTVAVGEVLPAAGLALRVFSLRTGEILPVGEDAAGGPVYEVYSDADGKYQLYLPETEVANVLLQAFVPSRADKRLDLRLVIANQQAAPALDEDTALVSDFTRKAFTDNMEIDLKLFTTSATIEEAVVKNTGIYSAIFKEPLIAMRRKLFTAAEKAGVKSYDDARLRTLAQRITDAALSHMKLLEIQTTFSRQKLTRPDEPALPALAKLLRESREQVRTHMRGLAESGQDIEAYYNSDPILLAVNAKTKPPFVIKTPSDAMVFFVQGLISNPQMPGAESGKLLEEIQASPRYNFPEGTLSLLLGATRPIEETYIKTFYLDEEAAKDAVAAIEAGVP